MTAIVDHYDLLETAAMQLVRTELVTYFPAPEETVTKSDDTMLDQGHDYFVIFYPGSFPTTKAGNQVLNVDWEIIVDVMTRYDGTEPEAWTQFKTIRSEMFHLFNVLKIGRTLGGTARVLNVLLSAEERPRYVPIVPGEPNSGVAFIAQVMTVTVTEMINKV